MTTAMQNSSSVAAYFRAHAAASPGRMITLGVLGLVLLVVVALQVFSGPGSAGAAVPPGTAFVDPLPVLRTPVPAVGTGLPAGADRPPLPPLPAELVRDLFASLPSHEAAVSLPGLPVFGPELLQENPGPLSDDNTVDPTDLRLQATYESTGRPPFLLAVIGGRTVRVGDRAGAWEVESIRPREVTIRSGGRSVVLRMP